MSRSLQFRHVRPLVTLAAVSAFAVLTALSAALAANVALVANDPLIQRIGYSSAGGTPTTGEIHDGNTGTVMYGMTNSFRNQMGYSLNAQAFVDSITIRQNNGGGARKRVLAVDVYTSNNHYVFTGLPDTDVVTLALDGSRISELMIVPITKQATGTDDNVGIAEIEVSSARPIAARTNWALGITPTPTTIGNYNSGSMAGLTDGNLYTSAIYKTPGGAAVFDLGAVRDIGGFGIAWEILLNRQVFQSAVLEFSNVSDFSVLEGSANLNFVNLLEFQQVDFAAVSARYVRVTDIGRLQPSGVQTDSNTGLIEMQILSPIIPEPATGLLLAGLAGLCLRRRKA